MSAPVSAKEGLTGFTSVIDVYEHRIGHVCRAVSSHFPQLVKNLPTSGGLILDNACGTGAAATSFLKAFPNASIYAADVVPPMIASFKAIIAQNADLQKQIKEVRLEDAQNLTFADDFFDASLTNFGIFFFPNPDLGAKQIYRTLKPGGIAIVTAWKTFGFKPILWEVQNQIKPQNPLTQLPLMEPWCDSSLLEGTLKAGGFKDVEFTVVKEGLWGSDKDDFKHVLLENFGAFTSQSWTDEERARLPATISKVIDEQQDKFCITDGAKVGCAMEAWVAVATK
jgi:ubiquinone/menaquinone biosynthesis C-methylase UbiE